MPSSRPVTDDPAATILPEPPSTGLRHRHNGWTADRQRQFIATLANTGSVTEAARAAGIAVRSAYRLRHHPQGHAFARAWEAALMTAASRLTAVAFDRALTGAPRRLWREGELVATTTVPSDRMLMFLLRHLQPRLFGADADIRDGERMRAGYGAAVEALADAPVDCDLLAPADIMLDAFETEESQHTL
jgi:hypothetical protein